MNFEIYSYVSLDLNPEVSYYQNKVFDRFGLKINQISGYALTDEDKYIEHGEYFSEVMNRFDNEYFIFFDVDCIPTDIGFLTRILHEIENKHTLSGAVGCANHINTLDLYIHSCFFGCSKKLFLDCGSPDLKHFEHGDTAQRFTQVCRQLNKTCIYWDVTDSEDFVWDLIPTNKKFVHGTTYENLIYHQFEIRKPEQQYTYIKKCKSLLL